MATIRVVIASAIWGLFVAITITSATIWVCISRRAVCTTDGWLEENDYCFFEKETKMKISRSTGYGLLAVGYIAKHQDEKIILSQSISREYKIPLEYLLKILQQLVRANVLRSKRGPRGGFSLAKSPKRITMLEIIEAVEGPMTNQLNLKEQAPKEKFSGKAVFSKAKIGDMM
jgi:Rrf2 family protein